jgi:dephospho-CoA kinase
MPAPNKKIMKIGITGGIGSGKTAVCNIFEKLGVPVLHSDDIAKDISDSNPIIRERLTALLGQETYSLDGSLNRSFLASSIFSNRTLRRKVEAVIHPYVERERERLILDLQAKGHLLTILETALLYEVGLDKKLDFVVVVEADEEVRFNRVCRRDAVSEDSVRARSNAQLNTADKLRKADYVIYNNNTLEELESKVRFLYNVFIQIIKKDRSV